MGENHSSPGSSSLPSQIVHFSCEQEHLGKGLGGKSPSGRFLHSAHEERYPTSHTAKHKWLQAASKSCKLGGDRVRIVQANKQQSRSLSIRPVSGFDSKRSYILASCHAENRLQPLATYHHYHPHQASRSHVRLHVLSLSPSPAQPNTVLDTVFYFLCFFLRTEQKQETRDCKSGAEPTNRMLLRSAVHSCSADLFTLWWKPRAEIKNNVYG